jgi:purine-binding chemotaxis protein CheW
MDSSEKQQILRARAQVLAQKKENGKDEEPFLPVIEFTLGSDRYAIETVYLQEVVPLKEITPLPCTPAFIRGLINIRGRIISVIDLSLFFGLPQKDKPDHNKIIIVRKGEIEFGILAESINGISGIPLKNIRQPLPPLDGIGMGFLLGISLDRLIILDAGSILSHKKIIINEEVEM